MIWLSNNFCWLVCSLSFFRNEFDDARPHQVQHQREGHCRETKGLMSGTTTHCCLFHVYFEISICEYWLQILTFYWTFFFSFSFVSSMWSLCKWYFLGRVFISLRKKPFCLVYLILITPNFLKKNIEETINITYQPNTCWANVKEKSGIKNASRSRFMKRLISDNNFLDCFFL